MSISKGIWETYAVPPVAAGIAIVPPFADMVAKSAQQLGQPVPKTPYVESLKGGMKAAPTVGAIVGTQMIVQKAVENRLFGKSRAEDLTSKLASSGIVGAVSAPFLAVFNGQSMGWSARESLRKFTPKQALAIAVQETAFVGGLSASDPLSEEMKKQIGNSKAVEYATAFFSGAAGSVAGHPANTVLTRSQNGLKIDHPKQLM
ncbi:MAG: hypothetical protein K1X28_09880 [Parachlamydiales bacterium]|nr:hypothetical protein [Parachlamydiales bacterium]